MSKLEFLVPKSSLPFIHGKCEETLKSIEHATGTEIKFFSNESENLLCVITNPNFEYNPEAVHRAQKFILDKAKNPPRMSEKMTVPSVSVPRIIGLCGERIEKIRRTTLADVWIESKDKDEDIVTIEGTQSEIDAARAMIEEFLKG